MNPIKQSKTIKRKGEKLSSKKGVVAIERRKHPRFNLELPLDYFRIDDKENYGGISPMQVNWGYSSIYPKKWK